MLHSPDEREREREIDVRKEGERDGKKKEDIRLTAPEDDSRETAPVLFRLMSRPQQYNHTQSQPQLLPAD